jgi:hypothetical protein
MKAKTGDSQLLGYMMCSAFRTLGMEPAVQKKSGRLGSAQKLSAFKTKETLQKMLSRMLSAYEDFTLDTASGTWSIDRSAPRRRTYRLKKRQREAAQYTVRTAKLFVVT